MKNLLITTFHKSFEKVSMNQCGQVLEPPVTAYDQTVKLIIYKLRYSCLIEVPRVNQIDYGNIDDY